MDIFLSGSWHHYIIVDKNDLDMFNIFAGPRRTILLTNDVAPSSMYHVSQIPFGGGRSLWWARKTGFFVGWHMQQIIKMGVASILSEQGLAYCDSDVFFVRPFDTAQLNHGGRQRFFRSKLRFTLQNTGNPKYTKAGLEILNLPINEEAKHHTYIDNFVTWHRPTVLALRDHIEKVSGHDWYTHLGGRFAVSEYTLYGLFVDEVAKPRPAVFAESDSLCKTQWNKQSKTEAEVESFCQDLAPHHVAVGVQSFAGVDLNLLKKQLALAISRYSATTKRET